MRLSSRSNQDDFELNVIPLIDVLLCLLMFFALTTTFVHQTHMDVTLPEASAESRDAGAADVLVVGVDREGHFYVGNHQVPGTGVVALKQALQRSVGSARDMPVLLRADGMTPHQAVVTAMDALGQLGFSELRIATVSPRGGQGSSN